MNHLQILKMFFLQERKLNRNQLLPPEPALCYPTLNLGRLFDTLVGPGWKHPYCWDIPDVPLDIQIFHEIVTS